MFSNLLIPLDATPQSAVALPLASAMARATGAKLTLLRVVSATDNAHAVSDAQRTVDRIAEELSAGGLTVSTIVRTGDPAEQIEQQARAQAADLIVMRTHGRAGLERAVLGSVTERVLTLCPVPLLLLRPGGHRVSTIRSLLVPIDGSPGGALALGAAVALAQATGASLRLLEVVVPIPNYIYTEFALNAVSYVDPTWDEEAQTSAQTYVDAIAARLCETGLAVEGEIRVGASIADTICGVAEAHGVDIIVMSTDALTGAARAVLGSVADAVVRSAQCPVLLLRREPPAAPHGAVKTANTRSREPDLIPTGT
jgi:nucleotide-binding universal stress UspA family protein